MENGHGDRFRYDEEGQLVEAWYNAADPANSGAGNSRYDGFNYDALGNRAGDNFLANHGPMTFTRKDNGLNQYRAWMPFSYTNYDDDIGGTWGAPGHANGVLMQDGNVTAGFNALNQPMMINSAATGGNWMFFGYDPLGRCVKRWVGALYNGGVPPPNSGPATYFYYDGWSLIQEGPNSSAIDQVYMLGNRMDEIVADYSMSNNQWLYHHSDARGHCILLTDSSGNLVEQYEYDAFGQPYFFSSTAQPLNSSTYGNRFLFTGREYLSDVKLYDYRARMYQPELGRFLQPDPKQFSAGDYNLYRYCHNDPINRNDPFGLVEDSPANLAKREEMDRIAKDSEGSHRWDQNARYDGAFREGANKCARFVHDVAKKAGASPPMLKDRETGNTRSATAGELATQKFKDWRALKSVESPKGGDIAAYEIPGHAPAYTGHAGFITTGIGPGLDGRPILSNESVHGNIGVYPDANQFVRGQVPEVTFLRYTGE